MQYRAPETVRNGRLFYCLYADVDRGHDPRPRPLIIYYLYYIYYIQDVIYTVCIDIY
nr:MAG TPA: hypothetical protein [Caudoviricetes sp.]